MTLAESVEHWKTEYERVAIDLAIKEAEIERVRGLPWKCQSSEGVTHFAGCQCWEESHQREVERLHERIRELENAALRRVSECEEHVRDVERAAVERAAKAMNPMLRSMISRDEAARLIRESLPTPSH